MRKRESIIECQLQRLVRPFFAFATSRSHRIQNKSLCQDQTSLESLRIDSRLPQILALEANSQTLDTYGRATPIFGFDVDGQYRRCPNLVFLRPLQQ
jgi:hypothetical protein